MKTIKVGVIGTGFIGKAHIEGIRRVPGLEVYAVAEQNKQQLDKIIEELYIPVGYNNYNDLLKDQKIDSVHICVPNNLHYKIAKAAIIAGKHVVCEKPLAVSTDEANELASLAADRSLITAVHYNLRFYPIVRHARDLVVKGKLGRVLTIHGSYLQDWLLLDTDYNWRLDSGSGGKSRAFADIGTHWIDMISFITGKKVVEVFSEMQTLHETRKKPKNEISTFSNNKVKIENEYENVSIDTEDLAIIIFKFDDGTLGNLVVNQMAAGRKNRLHFEINGENSSFIWNSEKPDELNIGYRDRPNELLFRDPSVINNCYTDLPASHSEGFSDAIKKFNEEFYSFVRFPELFTEREPDFTSFTEGAFEVNLCEKVIESSTKKEWVKL